ncbi:MAG: hypothetical protein V3R86_01440 [Candidatus Hydrothermarchaeaceae archaeon]
MTRKQQKKPPKRKSEAEKLWLKIKGKYPNCTGSYPECPKEVGDKNKPDNECRHCPVYLEWKR